MKAVERFEPERGLSFSTFAGPTILGELKPVSRSNLDGAGAEAAPGAPLAITRTRNELSQQFGRVPTPAEIAAAAGVTEEQILEGMEASTLYRLGSLDVSTDPDDVPASDRVGSLDLELNSVENRALVRDALTSLPVRERRIVYLRFFELNQAEIVDRVGVSQMHVSRLLTRSLERAPGATGRRRGPGETVSTNPSRAAERAPPPCSLPTKGQHQTAGTPR